MTLTGSNYYRAADRDEGAERGAVMRGDRLDVEQGKRLTVLGKLGTRFPFGTEFVERHHLLVIDHKAATVGGVLVAGWVRTPRACRGV